MSHYRYTGPPGKLGLGGDRVGEVVNWENRVHADFHNFTGPGREVLGWRGGFDRLLQYHTVEKTHQAVMRKCVWSGLVGLSGILRFLKIIWRAGLLIRFFRGFSVNLSFSFVCVILIASFQASSSFYSTGFPMQVRTLLSTVSWWLIDCKATGGWLAWVVLQLPQWRPRGLSTRYRYCNNLDENILNIILILVGYLFGFS